MRSSHSKTSPMPYALTLHLRERLCYHCFRQTTGQRRSCSAAVVTLIRLSTCLFSFLPLLYLRHIFRWVPNWNIAAFPASTSCVKITPDESKNYVQEDPLPEGRSMASLVFLADGRILCLNGASTGKYILFPGIFLFANL